VPSVSNSPEYSPAPPATSRTRLALLTLWTSLTVAAVAFVLVLGSNCPNADEWEFVPALTGHEPLGPWLWAQHNEHRLPLPRLVYYALFQITHDFRAGSLAQIAILSGTSLALMSLAARIRGYPYWTDAFFPVSIVHVGHWENLLIGYNICFAFILVLESAIGVVALRTTRETAFQSGWVAGVLMVLLCLCGGGGVVTAMPVAAWLAYLGFVQLKQTGPMPAAGPLLPPDALITNPIDLSASPEEKVRQLQKLTEANQPFVDAFLKHLDAEFGTTSNSNIKQQDRILAKASRPSIRAKKPWHGVEHIRDSFRFKTVLKDLRDLPAILRTVETKLGAEIIKRDTEKFLRPLQWGWRIVAFDLRMSNGQLVEYYLPVEEMERAKNEGSHELFEKWRNRDLATLTPEELRDMEVDLEESNRRYQDAYENFLSRSGATESELRATFAQVAASSEESAKNSLYISSAGNAIPTVQVFPSSQVDAANPASSTMPRPSGARDATAIALPPSSTANLPESGGRAKAAILFAFALFPVAYLALYLQDYHRPGHHPEVGEGGVDVLRVAGQVISMGFGYGIYRWWAPILAALLVLGGATAFALVRDALKREKRFASLGLVAIVGGIVGVALVIGLGRAGLDARNGLASRYTYLTWPLIALAYLVWTARGGSAGKWVPAALCLAAVLAYPANMISGAVVGSKVRAVLATVEAEARAGVPPEVIVRHFHNTFQAQQEQRAIRAIPMLREAGIGAFAEGRP